MGYGERRARREWQWSTVGAPLAGSGALAVTRDGKRILSGGPDNVLRVWDVETQQSIAKWGGHDAAIRCAVASPDNRLVASGNSEGRIVITEMKEDEQTKQHASGIKTARCGCVNSVCFSPDGTKLASAHDDKIIQMFDVESDFILGPIAGRTHDVYYVVWSLDGSRLFTASVDQTIRVWDAETGEPIGEPWTGHADYATSLSLSPDGAKLASGSHEKTVRF
jgi:WD40 repeat protein